MDQSKDLLALLQICDSVFPIGGFSHSLGLEACVKHHNGKQIDKDDLFTTFVCITENAGSFGIPFLKASHETNGNVEELSKLDEYCEACTSNHVAKRASTKQGVALAEIACTIFGELPSHFKSSLPGLPHSHFPVVFGAVMAGLGISMDVAKTAFLFSTARTAIASAVRLDVLGAVEGQKVQLRLQSLIPDIVLRNKNTTLDRVCIRFPLIDVLQNTQDTFYYKLFCS